MIAFHFPPSAEGSGHLRTLGMVRHLPALGWEPIVLSATQMAYPRTDLESMAMVPSDGQVHRAVALDAQRHLGIAGKYPAFVAQPDRWISWWPDAVRRGLRLIREHHIDAIWSTYPIMTAHVIAETLSRRTGLPWIADFRDPVGASVSRTNALAFKSQHRAERRVLERAARVVLTTPGALRGYAEQYPQAFNDGRLSVIPNGYDEFAFGDLPSAPIHTPDQAFRFVHSGTLYQDGRNPRPFFSALANLKQKGVVGARDIQVVLRASRDEAIYARELQRLRIEDLVTLAPPVTNREALREQALSDASLLFQGKPFARQIPAKVYEYLRIGRPIFALVDKHGDTAALLRQAGGAELVPCNDVDEIERRLPEFMRAVRDGTVPKADAAVVRGYSRQHAAMLLAELLGEVMV